MNTVQIAAKLYHVRDAMKSLYGERYPSKVQPMIRVLNNAAAKWDCSTAQAISRLNDELTQEGDNGVGLGLLFAAYVEDAEGTFEEAEKEK